MTKKAEAIIQIDFPSRMDAIVVEKSLRPEEMSLTSKRSRVLIRRRGRKVTLAFESRDVPALRASVNSFLNWLQLLTGLRSLICLDAGNDDREKTDK